MIRSSAGNTSAVFRSKAMRYENNYSALIETVRQSACAPILCACALATTHGKACDRCIDHSGAEGFFAHSPNRHSLSFLRCSVPAPSNCSSVGTHGCGLDSSFDVFSRVASAPPRAKSEAITAAEHCEYHRRSDSQARSVLLPVKLAWVNPFVKRK